MTHNRNKLILLALGISDHAYSELIYNRGLDWIATNMSPNNEYVLYEIAKTPKFWEWWTNQWEIRDEEYCFETSLLRQSLPLYGTVLLIAKELYVEKHAVKNIIAIPNRFVRIAIAKTINQQIKGIETASKLN